MHWYGGKVKEEHPWQEPGPHRDSYSYYGNPRALKEPRRDDNAQDILAKSK
jgi:hypothetical protein